jgi:hypothetical protein
MAIDKARGACGQIEVAKGEVQISSPKQELRLGTIGSKVCSGDTVISGPAARVRLKMEDGNELNIAPDSKIALENYQFEPAQNKKKVLLNVLQGKVRAATKQENMYNDKSTDGAANSFQVKTKTAVAGVRGTDFLTSYDPKSGASQVVTFKGTVAVGQPGPGGQILNAVAVKAGQTTSSSIGKPPGPPQAVPPAQFQQLNSDSKAESNVSTSSSSNGSSKSANANGQANGQTNSQSNTQTNSSANSQSNGQANAPSTNPSGADPAASASTGTATVRSPASLTSMLNTGDLGGAAGTTGPAPISSPLSALPSVNYTSPVPPLPPVVPVCQQCISAAQGAPTQLLIRIHIGGTN